MRMCHLIAFAGGMLAGGAIALMFAPKRGDEFRKDIKDKLHGVKRKIEETAACCQGGCGVEESVNVTVEE